MSLRNLMSLSSCGAAMPVTTPFFSLPPRSSGSRARKANLWSVSLAGRSTPARPGTNINTQSGFRPFTRMTGRDWMGAVGAGSPVYRTQGRVWSAKHQAWRAFQTRGVPIRDKTGKIIEWVGALTDVQDALDAQEKLLRREGELAES